MADKPSRALVVFADGHAALLPSQLHQNLDYFASLASCGFLSLRSPPLPPEDNTEDDGVILELAQLLDVYDFYAARNEENSQAASDVGPEWPSVSKISKRFMGLRAAMFTSSPGVSSFASSLGFDVFETKDLITPSDSSCELPQKDTNDLQIIYRILGLLGFSSGHVQETSEFDLVFLHVCAEKSKMMKEKVGNETDLNRLDQLVGRIMEAACPSSDITSRLHLSVILSYGSISKGDEQCSLISISSMETNSDLSLLRPRQSYCMKAGNLLDDIRHHHPMLVAQWQEGVTRRDLAKLFSFEEFIKYGGNLAMLAERFLHEVAFKLWKAPKYGA